MNEPQLKNIISDAVIRMNEIKEARKKDQDYAQAKGRVRVIEEGYKKTLDKDDEEIDFALTVLENRGAPMKEMVGKTVTKGKEAVVQ